MREDRLPVVYLILVHLELVDLGGPQVYQARAVFVKHNDQSVALHVKARIGTHKVAEIRPILLLRQLLLLEWLFHVFVNLLKSLRVNVAGVVFELVESICRKIKLNDCFLRK